MCISQTQTLDLRQVTNFPLFGSKVLTSLDTFEGFIHEFIHVGIPNRITAGKSYT